MEMILKFRKELKNLGKGTLLKMAFSQKEKHCVLSGLCPFYLDYKGYGFCVSEIAGEGCQDEKLRGLLSSEDNQNNNPCSEDLLPFRIGP